MNMKLHLIIALLACLGLSPAPSQGTGFGNKERLWVKS
jgi:hypothetical protein